MPNGTTIDRRICPECKKEFTTTHWRKIYCSKSCKGKKDRRYLKLHPEINNRARDQKNIEKTQKPKFCPVCQKEFYVDIRHINQKYCSRKCGRRFTYLNGEKIYTKREFQCSICGKSFIETSRRNRKYCGSICETKAHSARGRKDIDNGEICKLYRSGLSMVTIGQQFGISDYAVRKRLIKYGVPLRDRHLSKHNSNWKGGRHITPQGYVEVLNPEYRNMSKCYYIGEHRLVWEKTHNKKLPDGYWVHHFNGIKTDNRPENLIAMPRSLHSPLSIIEPYKKRIRELENMVRQYQNNQQLSIINR